MARKVQPWSGMPLRLLNIRALDGGAKPDVWLVGSGSELLVFDASDGVLCLHGVKSDPPSWARIKELTRLWRAYLKQPDIPTGDENWPVCIIQSFIKWVNGGKS